MSISLDHPNISVKYCVLKLVENSSQFVLNIVPDSFFIPRTLSALPYNIQFNLTITFSVTNEFSGIFWFHFGNPNRIFILFLEKTESRIFEIRMSLSSDWSQGLWSELLRTEPQPIWRKGREAGEFNERANHHCGGLSWCGWEGKGDYDQKKCKNFLLLYHFLLGLRGNLAVKRYWVLWREL